MADDVDDADEETLEPDPDGMRCHECEEQHTDWTKDGEHSVDGPYHSGIVERWECGKCGSITEGCRR